MNLNALLAAHDNDILCRERNNDNRIYLYDIRGYWVAFEQSACLLQQLFPQSRISLLRSRSYPLPVVMASVADDAMQGYFRQHIVKPFRMKHKILLGLTLSQEYYKQWHEGTLASFM